MHWEISFGFAFLLVFLVTLYGAKNGWFSRIIRDSKGVDAGPPPDPTEPYKDLIKKLEAKIFELENELADRNARISDLLAKIKSLMENINQLTINLQNATTLNEQLKTALRNALDDLAKCRAELQKCKSKELADQIQKQVCKMQPENANLLR
jgi:septal ring factor EnvC (AmiA/AmiB activator)